MAWRGRRNGAGSSSGDPWSIAEQPAGKRRKIEKTDEEKGKEGDTEETKDEWDDSVEFTQAELETLDIMASQAMQAEDPNPATTTEQTSETSFVIPTHAVRGVGNRSSSSSSDSSLHPPSLSSRSSINTSGSLSSHPSSNGKLDPNREMLQTLQAKLKEEVKRAQEEKYRASGEIMSLQERLHKQEEELEQLRAQRDERYYQQKQAQTEKIQKLQSEMESFTSQAQFKDREFQELREQNLALRQKLKKLEQLQQQSGSKSPDPHLSPTPKQQASPRKVPVQPSPPGRQQLQKQQEETSGPHKQGFPTHLTFMEKPSPSSAKTVAKSSMTVASASCQTDIGATKPAQCRRLHLNPGTSSGQLTGPKIVRCLLQASGSSSSLKEGSEKAQWDPGLAGLLHAKSISLRVAGLTYHRGKESPYLSPVRPPKRYRQLLRSPDYPGEETVQVVSRENFQLAIEGLSMMLESADYEHKVQSNLIDDEDPHVRFVASLAEMRRTPVSLHTNLNQYLLSSSSAPVMAQSNERLTEQNGNSHKPDNASSAQPAGTNGQSSDRGLSGKTAWSPDSRHNHGAVMLLPLLTDYIHHYVDLINSPSGVVQPGAHSPSSFDSSRSFADSSSYDSSLESLSTHIAQLLNEGKVYASSVESHAVSALRCLALLIQLCPVAGHVIIDSHVSTTVSSVVTVSTTTTSSSSTVETLPEPPLKRKTSSGAEADDEHSTSSSEIRVIAGSHDQSMFSYSRQHTQNRGHSTLLHLIMRLAGQDLEDSQSSWEVVKLALNILTCLCQCCPRDQMPKLEVFITRGILTNCFKQTKYPSVLLWAQRLLTSLAKCEKLLARLCTKSENCPLYLMHIVCSMNLPGMTDFYMEYITGLSGVISEHTSELSLLLCNSCPCSNQLVVAVVMAMHKLFSIYKKARAQCKHSLLSTLAQGAVLIHTIAQGDAVFAQHHAPVQLQYVRLLSGLVSVMRPQYQEWELQLSALEELCDFEPDISDMSQESESEDRMDQS